MFFRLDKRAALMQNALVLMHFASVQLLDKNLNLIVNKTDQSE